MIAAMIVAEDQVLIAPAELRTLSPMPWPHDRRSWGKTDQPGERLTIARPLAGIEVLSVSGSKRYWRESHNDFTLGVIHRQQDGVLVEWRTRARSSSSASGDIMAIEPGDLHVTEHLRVAERGADFDVVRFSPSFLTDVAYELGVRGTFHFDAPAVRDPLTFSALRGLVDAVAEGREGGDLESACSLAAHAVTSRLAEAPAPLARANPIRDFRMRRLVDYLRANLTKRPSLAELAAVTQLSKWRLCVIFEQTYGISIGNYWRELRSRDAGRRLRRGVPIKMVVSELGYADEPHFSREFKAHYGLTPGRWLSLCRDSRLTRAR
ncbi:MAG: AraC family transcriptional regulator [Polyangiaceae bacterium]